jgi:hypothetical protein
MVSRLYRPAYLGGAVPADTAGTSREVATSIKHGVGAFPYIEDRLLVVFPQIVSAISFVVAAHGVGRLFVGERFLKLQQNIFLLSVHKLATAKRRLSSRPKIAPLRRSS